VWPAEVSGVLELGAGRGVRGRSLRAGLPDTGPPPEWGLYLLGSPSPPTPWAQRWVRWRDFGLPADRLDAVDALREALRRSAVERVEIACAGGVGRTGTALAALLVLEGEAADDAVMHVRRHYHPRAVETPWQRAWLAGVARAPGGQVG
jgi:hypothetical protein